MPYKRTSTAGIINPCPCIVCGRDTVVVVLACMWADGYQATISQHNILGYSVAIVQNILIIFVNYSFFILLKL